MVAPPDPLEPLMVAPSEPLIPKPSFGGGSSPCAIGGVVEQFHGARPWVMFMSISAFVMTGTGVLGSVALFLSWLFTPELASAYTFQATIIGSVYLGFSSLCLVVGLAFLRYAGSIEKLVRDPDTSALEKAAARQRAVWRLSGMVTALLMLFWFAAVVGWIVVMTYFASKGAQITGPPLPP